ncbi:1-phosphofructokinase family hexose kinase [Salsipaludibacter albus]|uniref:1-phosphofructokinase family hexose kinase n=1 Tax=Salsipaludibacter albus TaxID=2849650 RepID=UPI001EE3BB98|nr:phosphofructokinase [Salsipaludibacter albus]
MDHDPTIAILAPSLFVTITIEQDAGHEERDEIHLHAGGQAVWVARMVSHLGERPVVCAPLGGETGMAMEGLVRDWQIELDAVRVDRPSPAYVHDRRGGERQEIARSPVPELDRHDIDELYGRMLQRALATGVCVITGRLADDVPPAFYARLASDLAESDVAMVGDLHGDELDAWLDAGRLDWLKVSAEDLVADGVLEEDADEEEILAVAADLADRGAERVVVSRSSDPAVVHTPERRLRVEGPALEVVDHTGAGDSMTAALAVVLRRGGDTERAVRLAWAAGAANVVRHGLGSASPDLVDTLADRATVTTLS